MEDLYKRLDELESKIYEADCDYEELQKMRTEYETLIRTAEPFVGAKATIYYYSDSRAATVVEMKSNNVIGVRLNQTKCNDWFGNNYDVLPELYGEVEYYSKRKSGRWRKVGFPDRWTEVELVLHCHRHYIDPSF